MNDAIRVLYDRKSVRRFLPRPVEREKLSALFDAAVQAPCGGNTQQWKFFCLMSESVREELSAAVRLAMRDFPLGENPYKSMANAKRAAQKDDYCCYFHAPVWILIAMDETYPNAMADAALAMGNLMHAATAEGLGTCWVNQVPWTQDDPRVREVLQKIGVPDGFRVCATAAVGYPETLPNKPARKPADVTYL